MDIPELISMFSLTANRAILMAQVLRFELLNVQLELCPASAGAVHKHRATLCGQPAST